MKAVPVEAAQAGAGETRLIARDDKKNPLISTFDWTADATQRILRVPAGFMRNKTQERIEELARERDAKGIDLALVEEGIEMGKKMMAEMIATYSPPASTTAKHNLNEVSPLKAPTDRRTPRRRVPTPDLLKRREPGTRAAD